MKAGAPFLRRAEPRAKMVGLVAVTASVFGLRTPLALLVLALVLSVAVWRAGGLGGAGRRFLLAAAAGYPAMFLIFAASSWPVGQALGSHLAASAAASGMFSGRLATLVLANLLFVRTTDPREFARSLRGWLLPAELCVMAMIVLHFITLAGQQARRILEAQRCRGYRLSHLWWPSAWLPLGVPLLVHTLHRAESLAISLELRGFSAGIGALAPVVRWRWPDFALAGGSVLGAVAIALTL